MIFEKVLCHNRQIERETVVQYRTGGVIGDQSHNENQLFEIEPVV